MSRRALEGPFRGDAPVAGYAWLEHTSRSAHMRQVLSALARRLPGRLVLVTAFDGGPMRASSEELALGWRQLPAGALSPPLREGLDVPWEQRDEWWVFADAERAAALPDHPRFANLFDGSLRTPAELTSWFDPTWERDVLDWLPQEQERFWELVAASRPLAYVSHGDRLIVVSSVREVLDDLGASIARGEPR